MHPNSIKLESLDKLFQYETYSRLVDDCDDLEILKNMTKSYIKLYLKQQEIISELGTI
jgi:hypothetical protein